MPAVVVAMVQVTVCGYKATCTVSDSTPAIGETVTFTATGLQGGGVTPLKIISATNGS
jgi:hypothetical protein